MMRRIIILLLILLFVPWSGIQAETYSIYGDCSTVDSHPMAMACCDIPMSMVDEGFRSADHATHQTGSNSCCLNGMCPLDYGQTSDLVLLPQRHVIPLPVVVGLALIVETSSATQQRVVEPPPLLYRTVDLHLRNCTFLI
jgi:hypothetical protein